MDGRRPAYRLRRRRQPSALYSFAPELRPPPTGCRRPRSVRRASFRRGEAANASSSSPWRPKSDAAPSALRRAVEPRRSRGWSLAATLLRHDQALAARRCPSDRRAMKRAARFRPRRLASRGADRGVGLLRTESAFMSSSSVAHWRSAESGSEFMSSTEKSQSATAASSGEPEGRRRRAAGNGPLTGPNPTSVALRRAMDRRASHRLGGLVQRRHCGPRVDRGATRMLGCPPRGQGARPSTAAVGRRVWCPPPARPGLRARLLGVPAERVDAGLFRGARARAASPLRLGRPAGAPRAVLGSPPRPQVGSVRPRRCRGLRLQREGSSVSHDALHGGCRRPAAARRDAAASSRRRTEQLAPRSPAPVSPTDHRRRPAFVTTCAHVVGVK